MQEFHFREHSAAVRIDGREYRLDLSAETGDFLISAARRMKELAAEIERGEAGSAEAAAYGVSVIDRLLGHGAAEKIFAGRKKSLSDVGDVLGFLIAAAKELKEARA